VKNLVILGSARKESNTLKAVKSLTPFKEYELIDLLDFNIQQYKYDHNYSDQDQFGSVIDMVLAAENIVFATPVYWYSMSGHMKVFFDRLTDLVTVDKDLGRSLKGKSTYLIAAGGESKLPEGFEVPFIRTSKYLDMNYVEGFYAKL
jgi:multimeric flavodoxin WrbA